MELITVPLTALVMLILYFLWGSPFKDSKTDGHVEHSSTCSCSQCTFFSDTDCETFFTSRQ